MPGAHKIGAAIAGPRITGGNFMDTALFLILRTEFLLRKSKRVKVLNLWLAPFTLVAVASKNVIAEDLLQGAMPTHWYSCKRIRHRMGTGVERLKEIDAANLKFIICFFFLRAFFFPYFEVMRHGVIYYAVP